VNFARLLEHIKATRPFPDEPALSPSQLSALAHAAVNSRPFQALLPAGEKVKHLKK
jgi:hypothetical protein